MNPTEFKDWLETKRAAIDRECRSRKNSTAALFELFDLYRSFNDEERAMADDVIAQWTLVPEESIRYDAVALIREFRIAGARVALHELARRLLHQRSSGAPFELDRVRQLLEELPQ